MADPNPADDDIYAALNHVLTIARGSLADPPKQAFVSLGAPPGRLEDYMAIWARGFYPSATFPQVDNGPSPCGTALALEATIRIMRECWPQMRGSTQPVLPSVEQVDAAAKLRLREGRQIQAALSVAARAHPAAVTPWPGYTALVGRARPVLPQARMAGWDIELIIQVREG